MIGMVCTTDFGFSFLRCLTEFFSGLCPMEYPRVVARSARQMEVFLDKDTLVAEIRALNDQSWTIIVDRDLIDETIVQTVVLRVLFTTEKVFRLSPMEVIDSTRLGYTVIVE